MAYLLYELLDTLDTMENEHKNEKDFAQNVVQLPNNPLNMSDVKKAKRMASLDVVLDNPSKVFFSGEIISGLIKFETDPHLQLQILSVNLNAEYYLTKNDVEVVEVIYSESCPIDLGSAGEGNKEMPFSLVVRPESPTSLATPLGGIRYRVLSSLLYKDENAIHNTEKSEFVSVNMQKQLTDESAGSKVSSKEGLKWLPCCCGSVATDFEVVNVSLLCGSCAIINACIMNNTVKHIQGTSVAMIQKVTRLRDKKTIKSTVGIKERGTILPGKRQVWLSDRFLVPPLPPTSSDSYFRVSYKMVMTVQKTNIKATRLKIPIIIGNLPREADIPSLNSQQAAVGPNGEGIAEGRCCYLSPEVAGFRPLYVTYIS